VKKTVKKAAVPNKAAKSADLSKWYGKWYIKEIVYFSFLFLSSKAARSLSLEDRINDKRERERREMLFGERMRRPRPSSAQSTPRDGKMRASSSDRMDFGCAWAFQIRLVPEIHLGNIGLMVILSPSSCRPSSSFVRAFFLDFVVKKKVKRERESVWKTQTEIKYFCYARAELS